ncbi:MAG: STAS domain-containing protein [Bacteroidales bacterium]|jgi:anti-anti-sigma factor|nr:STAS domain-containing protein [Bacteroidales bacterium]
MNITISKSGETSIVQVEGRLDTTNYGELEHHLSSLTENNEYRLLLDLEKLEYISSSGLRILLIFLKKIKAANGRFMLCTLTPEIREIFEISGFINIFDIYEDQKAALDS